MTIGIYGAAEKLLLTAENLIFFHILQLNCYAVKKRKLNFMFTYSIACLIQKTELLLF